VLSYNDMDERLARKVLQHSAQEIIARNGLAIAPHDLKLGKSYFL